MAQTKAYLDRSFELEQDWLRDEDLTALSAKVSDLRLQQLHLLSWSASAHLQQPVYDRVQIDIVRVRHNRRRGENRLCSLVLRSLGRLGCLGCGKAKVFVS